MAKLSGYPGVSSRINKQGKVRWTFRRDGKVVYLPGEPHTPAFDDAYQALIEGRVVKKETAQIIAHPRAANPASLTACWLKVRTLSWWGKLDPLTQSNYAHEIEELLDRPVSKGIRLGDGPVIDLKPRHVRDIVDQLSASRARVLMTVLRKMMKEARLQDWIEYDPTYGVELPERESDEGHRAWPPEFCAKYEARWPIGSTPRTVYELARWLGARRSDIALVRNDQQITRIEDGVAQDGFLFVQHKGRRKKGAFAKFHPISDMLAEALAPLDRSTATVLAKPNGDPYSMKSLTSMMSRDWAPAAGVPAGYSLHGLRKAMGGMLVDADATLHESRDVLGHATYKEVARYNKSRDQAQAATRGIRKVVKMVRPG